MSMNVFNSSGTAFLGPQPFAFDRSKMLLGLPATFITTGITGGSGEDVYLPADLDGSTLPPLGARRRSWNFRAEVRIGPSTSMLILSRRQIRHSRYLVVRQRRDLRRCARPRDHAYRNPARRHGWMALGIG
jgi:hypothetical protein